MATYYINPTSGNDANNGTTKALAVKTFSDANGLLASGDTLKIVDGTHDVSSQAGTVTFSQDNLTIESENLDYTSCTLDCVNTALTFVYSNGFTAKGFAVHRFTASGSDSGVFKAGGAYTAYFRNIVASDYTFNSSYQGLIFVADQCTTYVTGCGFVNPLGTLNYTQGIVGGGSATPSGTLYFHNNTIYVDGSSGDGSIIGIRGPSVWTIDIKNTIIDTQANFNIYELNGAVDWSSSDVNISYSCLYDNGGTGSINTRAFTVGDGMITTDPKLVDPLNYVFALEPDSPCIDTGGI